MIIKEHKMPIESNNDRKYMTDVANKSNVQTEVTETFWVKGESFTNVEKI